MSEKKRKPFDTSIRQPKEKYVPAVQDWFRDNWTPKRSINVAGHAIERPKFERADGDEER